MLYNPSMTTAKRVEGKAMSIQDQSSYDQALATVRRLSPSEQLALISEIVTGLRQDVYAADDLAEAEALASSPAFRRLVDRALAQIEDGQARPIEALMDEL